MSTINSLGENLNVVILVDTTFQHDWMSFGLWYSLSKNAPDANVFVRFKSFSTKYQFHWPARMGVKVVKSKTPGKTLVVPPHLVMVRELDGKYLEYLNGIDNVVLEELCCTARDFSFRPFVSYQEGCGMFNSSKWIDINRCPYDAAESLMTHEATVNEVKILQMWARLGSIYSIILRR